MTTLRPLLVLLALGLGACQTYEYTDEDTTADLDGVWQGVFSTSGSHESLRTHMLDGLALSLDRDRPRAHSAEMVLDRGELAGLFAHRGPAGERDEDFSVLGTARAYDRIEADLLGDARDARLSLFYDEARSFERASLHAVEGLYAYYGPDIEITLSIDAFGDIEGYDDAGCGYFGHVSVPDRFRNLYVVSLDVEGCALAGDYGYGIASLDTDAGGWEVLELPIWFDEQDRVEPWRMERI